MDPKLLETEVGMILDLDPPEIQAPVTLGKSQGTKIFASKNFSYHPQIMLFYAFLGFVTQKMPKIKKNSLISLIFLLMRKSAENDPFFSFLGIFCVTNPKNA